MRDIALRDRKLKMKKHWEKDTTITSQCKFSDKTPENIVNQTLKYSDDSVSTHHSVDCD